MKKISLFSPSINKLEIDSVIKTLKSGFWASGAGIGNVLEFENNFKRFTNAKECVAVDSGTAALHLALNVIDINKKEVLVPALTFASTINAIRYNGGVPKFVDVNLETLCLDMKDLERKITRDCKVILPVHFGGFPADLSGIKKIAKKNSLQVVEDAAHACGSKHKGKNIGEESEFVCFSFHPVKNLSMPKGGAITINGKYSGLLKNKMKSLRWCGISNRKDISYDISELGYNYYMDEISAAIGLIQLKKLKKLNEKRLQIAKRYNEELKITEKIPFNKECSYHLYWIIVKNRSEIIKALKRNGIETGTHYKPMHTMSLYKSKIKLQNTDKISNNILILPIHPNLTTKEIDHIIKTTNSLIT